MNYLWGSLMALMGLFMFVSALIKSENIVYRMFVARSKLLWGEHVHSFLMVAGIIVMGLSSLFFIGVWG